MTAGTKLSAAMPVIEAAGASALPLLLGYFGRVVSHLQLKPAEVGDAMRKVSEAYTPGASFNDVVKPLIDYLGTKNGEGQSPG